MGWVGKERCSIPIDMNATWDRTSSPNPPLRLPLQPLHCPFILLNLRERLQQGQAPLIMILDPRDFLLGKHRIADHLCLDGHDGEALEAEPDGPVEFVLGRDALDEEGGFDAHTKFSICVWRWEMLVEVFMEEMGRHTEAGFVGYDVPWDKWDI